MPRLSVEDKWFDDPRRWALVERIGRMAADAVALQIWRVAQNYFREETLIPKDVFFACEKAADFMAVGLAEERDNGVYVRGSRELFSWLNLMKQNGRKGGLAKASKSKQNVANPSKSKQIVACISSSISNTEERSINTNTICSSTADAADERGVLEEKKGEEKAGSRFAFEAVYAQYPRKQGKKRGLELCRKQVRTVTEYEALKRAVANYGAFQTAQVPRGEFRPKTRYFHTFMADGFWAEWIDPDWQSIAPWYTPPEPPSAGDRSASVPVEVLAAVTLEQLEADFADQLASDNPTTRAFAEKYVAKILEARRKAEAPARSPDDPCDLHRYPPEFGGHVGCRKRGQGNHVCGQGESAA